MRVVEFSKTVLKEAGSTFGRTRGGSNFRTFALSSLFKITFGFNGLSIEFTMPIGLASNLLASLVSKSFFADLGLLEPNGMAYVLAELSLVALSGQSANSLAGGGIPIPVPRALGITTTEYKLFGIGLTVSPIILPENRTALKAAPETSDLDFSRSVTLNGATVPAIVTCHADTTAEPGDGESFVTDGLISWSTLLNIDKVPSPGDVPVIGMFFKYLNYNQEERELVIIVMPYLVKPMARNTPIDKMSPGQSSGRDRNTVGDPVWRPFALGVVDPAAIPGFSK